MDWGQKECFSIPENLSILSKKLNLEILSGDFLVKTLPNKPRDMLQVLVAATGKADEKIGTCRGYG